MQLVHHLGDRLAVRQQELDGRGTRSDHHIDSLASLGGDQDPLSNPAIQQIDEQEMHLHRHGRFVRLCCVTVVVAL